MGPLSAFNLTIQPELDLLSTNEDEGKKTNAVKNIHRRILDLAYAIPLYTEAPKFLVSEGLDLSRFNPFDMRQRYYDIQW